MTFLEIIITVSFIAFLLYLYGTSTYDFWKSRGVPYVKPKYPFFGESLDELFNLKSPIEIHRKIYNSFPQARFCGYFKMRQPKLMIRDPELVETVTIKDFHNFTNRFQQFDTDLDPLAAHLVTLRDDKWKNLRIKLTPTFSSGKLKGMHDQLLECSEYLIEQLATLGENTPFEIREVTVRFTTDVISSCAFGINTDTLNNPDSKLRAIGKRMFHLSSWSALKRMLREEFGWVLRLLKWKNVPLPMEQYFVNLISGNLEYREKNNVYRPDFLQLLKELKDKDLEPIKNGKLSEDSPYIFSDKLLLANSFIFLLAGFETIAAGISFTVYELALNPDIQEKLYKVIKSAVAKYDGKPTYEAIKEMTYLTQVINETLRLHPPVPAVSRDVAHDYQISDSDVVIPKGTEIILPIYSIHHDPSNYPDPENFDPERFNDENKGEIKKGSFLPFGRGPRICIGEKFAMLEIKVALSKILLNYKILKCEKTRKPLVHEKRTIFNVSQGGIWVALEKRF